MYMYVSRYITHIKTGRELDSTVLSNEHRPFIYKYWPLQAKRGCPLYQLP